MRRNYSAPSESCESVIAQGKLPHGLKFYTIQLHYKYSTFSPLIFINISTAMNLVKIPNFIQQEVGRLNEGLKGDATNCYENYSTISYFHFRSENVTNIN